MRRKVEGDFCDAPLERVAQRRTLLPDLAGRGSEGGDNPRERRRQRGVLAQRLRGAGDPYAPGPGGNPQKAAAQVKMGVYQRQGRANQPPFTAPPRGSRESRHSTCDSA